MPSSNSRKQKLSLEDLSHKKLLWKYRNLLVHEANAGTKNIERPEFREPYYSWDLDLARMDGQKCWRLHFPLGFFRSLCESALEAVAGYLLKEEQNPLPIWDRWNWWIDELN